ncbi:MAG: LysM peptidoglycan-binding domain-containing protein [Deltaproteobacteria bacterium]|nr:LysM peptidoglycan-binding domain-containing protein [Deltaproteobacteria bacterium]
MMRQILAENGLPDDLVYLSMIESGFSSYAHSRASAVGQWQFIYHTGVRYGLKVNWWIDERRDPEKSTIAAAQYLKDLHDEFQHWYLAAAGYNAGEGKISRAIKRYQTDDFWEISKYRYIKPETKNYVPKLIAAAMIAKEPEKYGFTDIVYEKPLIYDTVAAPKPVELKVIADALGISVDEIKALNPELIQDVTPPKYPNYELKIPVGLKGIFLTKYEAMPEYEIKDVITHRVRSGEALSVIARRYGVSAYKIASFNNLRSQHQIRAGQNLKIPVPNGKPATAYQRDAAPMVADNGNYKVRSGDSFWTISRRFNLTVSQLRRMNPSINPSKLRPGQRLVVEAPGSAISPTTQQTENTTQVASADGWKVYHVRSGDNLWVIARRLGLPLNDLAKWNNLNPQKAILHPGKKLRFKS